MDPSLRHGAALAVVVLVALLAAPQAEAARMRFPRIHRILEILNYQATPPPPLTLSSLLAADDAGFVEVPLALAPDVPAQASAQAPGPAPQPGGVSCPPSVSQCDFYFSGSPNDIPTFSLGKSTADGPISPSIVTFVQQTQIQVKVLNTGRSQYICGTNSPAEDDQFYINGDVVQARTFQPNTLQPHTGQFVLLNLTSLEVFAYGKTYSINPSQPSSFFPSDRRCIVFKTGP